MSGFQLEDVPRLAQRTRLRRDEARNAEVLLFPEGVLVLNDTAAAVLALCDGEKTLSEIAAVLGERFGGADVTTDVLNLLDRLAAKGLVEGYEP